MPVHIKSSNTSCTILRVSACLNCWLSLQNLIDAVCNFRIAQTCVKIITNEHDYDEIFVEVVFAASANR